ncbi:MAG: RNA polymerase sigma factor [Ferruginibacter sp.]
MTFNRNTLSDQLLIEKILRGDTRSFSMIIADTERLVAQIVRKMISDEEEQKDLAQDIYLKVFQKLSTFKFQSKLSTWIAQVAYNTCCNYLEKRKIPLCDFDLLHENAFVYSDDTERETFMIETNNMLQAEIEKLPPLYKMLISLYHIEELSNKEISEITNLPEGTIKSYLYRARKLLKESISKTYKNDIL